MPEKLVNPEPVEISQYDELVAETLSWNERVGADGWEQSYAHLIQDETLEFLAQHGNTPALLLPPEMGVSEHASEEAIAGAVDELSDMFWFGFDTARRLGLSGTEVCNAALQRHFGEEAQTFAKLQQIVTRYAPDFRVPTKMALAYGRPDSETSLAQNPFYVFMRTSSRLCRSLYPIDSSAGPPTATDLETVMDRSEACGDFLLTLSYIAFNRLGREVEDVVLYNFQKLYERDRWGKMSPDDS